MSKKQEKAPPKSPQKSKKAAFPMCINNKQARMVCLSDSCESYPFFCSNCEDESCQAEHQHDDDKLTSISYKQFSKRVLRQRKPCDNLEEAISSYRSILEKLKDNVSEFIEKELANLDQIESESGKVEPEDQKLIDSLKNQKYKEFTGAIADQLWSSSAEDPQKKKKEEETAEFMKIKEEQVKGISEHFEHLNKLGLDNSEEDQKPKKNSNSKKSNKEAPKEEEQAPKQNTSPPTKPKK